MKWNENNDTLTAEVGRLTLSVDRPTLEKPSASWSVTLDGNTLRSGTAMTLESAQRAAEAYAKSNSAQSQASDRA